MSKTSLVVCSSESIRSLKEVYIFEVLVVDVKACIAWIDGFGRLEIIQGFLELVHSLICKSSSKESG